MSDPCKHNKADSQLCAVCIREEMYRFFQAFERLWTFFRRPPPWVMDDMLDAWIASRAKEAAEKVSLPVVEAGDGSPLQPEALAGVEEEEMIALTIDGILANVYGGSIRKAQCEALGLALERKGTMGPPKGWLEKLIGRQVTRAQWEAFVVLGSKR